MRKGVNEVGKSILNRLKKFDEISEFAATILHIELLAVGCNMIESNLKLQDAWSLLTRYDEPIIAENRDKTLLGKLRILLSHFSGQSYLEKEIERYLEIPIKYRLIDIDHNGQIVFGTPQYFPERKQKYINILQAPIENRENKLKYAEVGPFTYRRRKEDLYMEVKGSIPESWIKGVEKLPAYREKKSIQFDLDFDWSEVARDMDRILGNGKREWEKRIEHIQFQATDGEKIFSYHGVQHIVGGLSAGKSTFRTINTYWLVKKKGAKVGWI